MGKAEAVQRFWPNNDARKDRFDERRLVVPARQIEADRTPAPSAIIAIPMAQRIDPLLLGLLTPIFPRSHIFGDDRTAHDDSDTRSSSPTSYE